MRLRHHNSGQRKRQSCIVFLIPLIPARKQHAVASIYPNNQDPEPAAEHLTWRGQSLKLSTKAAVFKRGSFLIEGPSMSIRGPGPPWRRQAAKILVFVQDGLGGAMAPVAPSPLATPML